MNKIFPLLLTNSLVDLSNLVIFLLMKLLFGFIEIFSTIGIERFLNSNQVVLPNFFYIIFNSLNSIQFFLILYDDKAKLLPSIINIEFLSE